MIKRPLPWALLLISLLLNGYFLRLHFFQSDSTPVQPLQADKNTNSQYSAEVQDERSLSKTTPYPTNRHSNESVHTRPTALQDTLSIRDELYKQAKDWLDNKDFIQLHVFLQDYLQQHPLDMDFLLLEAQMFVQTELLSDAIVHYYSLKKLPMSAAQHQFVDDQISSLSHQTIEQLQKAYSWDTLAIFIEPLLQLEPQNREFILALAEAYGQQQQINLMENILAALDYQDPSAMRIRAMTLAASGEVEIDQSDQSTTPPPVSSPQNAIQLQQLGDQYVVHAQLADNNVALLIDTGASITAISEIYFRNLSHRYKIHFIGRFNVNTANGKVLAPMYQFKKLKINQNTVTDISVMILPMPNMENVNGLLGMNFLREFDFRINQREATLFLSPQK